MAEKMQIVGAFGVETNSSESVCFLDDLRFLYLCGSNLVVVERATYKSKIVPLQTRGKIEFVRVLSEPSKILVVEVDKLSSFVTLLELRPTYLMRKRSIKIPEELVFCVSIGNDFQNVAMLTSKRRLVISSLANLSQMVSIQTNEQAKEVSFFGQKSNRLLVIGSNLAKVYSFTRKKEIKLIYSINCRYDLQKHSWLTNTDCLCSDSNGKIYLIDMKSNQINPIVFQQESIDQIGILSLICGENYFALLAEKSNRLIFIKRSKTNTSHFMGKFWACLRESAKNLKSNDDQDQETIISMKMSPSKTLLIVLSSNKNLFSLDLSQLAIENQPNNSEIFFQPLVLSAHHARHLSCITGLATSLWSPNLVVSCSSDRNLVLWNVESSDLLSRHRFDEELLALSVHSSGLFLLVSTLNSLSLMGVYVDEPRLRVLGSLRVLKPIICEFANADDMFAFVHGTVIKIYSIMNFEHLGAVRTSEMGRIKQIKFNRNDSLLICCSVAGIIRAWNSRSLVVVSEVLTVGLSFTGMCVHPSEDWLFLISTEKAIRQYELAAASETARPPELVRKLETSPDENVTWIELSKKGDLIGIGTNKGSLRVYSLPSGVFREFRAHFTNISRLCFTSGDEHLVTGSEDGSVLVFKVQSSASQFFSDANEDLFLVDKRDQLARVESMKKLRVELTDSVRMKEFELEKQQLRFKILQRDVRLRSSGQMARIEASLRAIFDQRKKNSAEFNEKVNNLMIAYVAKFEETHRFYEEKISRERIQNSQLEEKLENLKAQPLNVPVSNPKIDYKLELDRRQNQFERELKEIEKRVVEQLSFEQDLEQELESESLALVRDLNEKCLTVFNQSLDLKNELKIMRTEAKVLRKAVQDYRRRTKEKRGILEALESQTKKILATDSQLKVRASKLAQKHVQELIQLDDEIGELEKKFEHWNLQRLELERDKEQLEKDHKDVVAQRAYFERELIGIEKEMSEKRVGLERAKYEFEYDVARRKAKAKVAGKKIFKNH